jgi:hypothetical protein
MTRDPRIVWLHVTSAADWIGPRLHGFALDTGSIVPEGFDAYCRVLHPFRGRSDDKPTRTWAEVAAENGRIMHPEVQPHTIFRPIGAKKPKDWAHDHTTDNELEWGSCPPAVLGALVDVLGRHTATPERCWFCAWEGRGFLDFDGVRERVRLPSRNYLLYTGPIELATTPLDDVCGRSSPHLWWPDDRAWIVATEIDFAWTYVGGASSLVGELLDDPRIEALAAELSDEPFYGSDTVNEALDAP